MKCFREGNGNPLQYSCLANPMDRGAWWAAVSGVAQSWTRLKRLSSSSNEVFYPVYWNRKRQPTPVFLPGKQRGQRSVAGNSPWGSKRVGRDWATEHTHDRNTTIIITLQVRRPRHREAKQPSWLMQLGYEYRQSDSQALAASLHSTKLLLKE